MPHIAIDPDVRDSVRTSEVRNTDIWQGTVRFDADGVSERDLDADVADAFVEAYGTFVRADAVDDAPAIDPIGALLDGTVAEVADAIGAGEYDEQLDDLEERADRVGVQEAIDERRDELEAEEE